MQIINSRSQKYEWIGTVHKIRLVIIVTMEKNNKMQKIRSVRNSRIKDIIGISLPQIFPFFVNFSIETLGPIGMWIMQCATRVLCILDTSVSLIEWSNGDIVGVLHGVRSAWTFFSSQH